MAQAKTRKTRTQVNKDETKAQKFVRLAQKRTSKALNALKGIAQLSGSGYESTPDQVAKIYKAISDAAQEGFQRFQSKGTKAAKDSFTL